MVDDSSWVIEFRRVFAYPAARRWNVALTRRQREVYDVIREFIEANGYSPSLEEIGGTLGLSSVATVQMHGQPYYALGRALDARAIDGVGWLAIGSDSASTSG